MLISAAYICLVIILEAGPVYKIFMAGVRNVRIAPLEWFWICGSFLVVAIITGIAVFSPMKLGVRRLSGDL
jgi:ABC-2 type transport system permease protein